MCKTFLKMYNQKEKIKERNPTEIWEQKWKKLLISKCNKIFPESLIWIIEKHISYS